MTLFIVKIRSVFRQPLIQTPAWLLCGLMSLFSPAALSIEVTEEIILRAEWPAYVNGASISALPQTQKILRRFDENGKMQLTIRYPSGEQGIAWGRQMLEWFVAYGVPGEFVRLELGSGGADQLVLQLVDRSR